MSQIALACPSIRTVVIAITKVGATHPYEPGNTQVYQVIAIRSEPGQDAKRVERLIIFERGRLREFSGEVVAENDPAGFGDYEWTVVLCPWDPSEDEERLAPEIEALKAKLLGPAAQATGDITPDLTL